MLWIDDKYANLLGHLLRNFKKKSQYLYNASCPVCGDSKKNPNKARLYFYRQTYGLYVKCHKCQYGASMGSFLKRIDSNLYSEYVLERYKNTSNTYLPHTDIVQELPVLQTELTDAVLDKLLRVDQLPSDHIAVQYCMERLIPKSVWNLLYYTPEFFNYVNDNIKYQFTKFKEDHGRLIIPFFKSTGKCFMLSGRTFGDEVPKYYTIKIDETADKIYGLDRVDYAKPIYVTEGPIDSLFLPNALAVAGSGFDNYVLRTLMTNITIIPDNEPRHKDVVKIIDKNIQLGYKIVLWPDTVKEKDINEMIMAGRSIEDVISIIKENTFSNLQAKVRFATWKKV